MESNVLARTRDDSKYSKGTNCLKSFDYSNTFLAESRTNISSNRQFNTIWHDFGGKTEWLNSLPNLSDTTKYAIPEDDEKVDAYLVKKNVRCNVRDSLKS